MASLKQLTATRIGNYFSTAFKRANGVSNLMRIDDGNEIINVVNVLAKNTTGRIFIDYQITDPGIMPAPVNILQAVGKLSAGSGIGCLDLAAQCGVSPGCCCSTQTCKCNNCGAITEMTRAMAPGVWNLTINLVDAEIADTIVRVFNPAVAAIVTVTKVDKFHYIITAVNGVGAPVPNAFDKSSLQVGYYFTPLGNPWVTI